MKLKIFNFFPVHSACVMLIKTLVTLHNAWIGHIIWHTCYAECENLNKITKLQSHLIFNALISKFILAVRSNLMCYAYKAYYIKQELFQGYISLHTCCFMCEKCEYHPFSHLFQYMSKDIQHS